MKKMIYTVAVAVVVMSIAFTSCTKNFTDINTDPNNQTNAQPGQLMAPALVNTLNYNMQRNRNFNNELMQVTVDMSDAEGKVFRYDYRATWADYLYNGWYSELTNFRDMYKLASNPLTANKSYMGISLICQSWIYSMLTDTYGDVPYTEAGEAKDSANYEPAFDSQKNIYLGIFSKLEEANKLLASKVAIDASNDPVYYGDVSKWQKFGNSLYLRLLMRVSGKAEVADTVIKKFKEIVEVKHSDYPTIDSNAESAILRWTGAGPIVSPYMSVREQDFRTPGLGSFFIDNLSRWSDPRIDIPTYGSGGYNRWAIAPYSGSYQGIPSGYSPGENPVKKSYFYSTSTKGATLMSEPLTGMMMNYAELQLILAEAAAKGWISGPASNYYNNGVKSSITLWVPKFTTSITTYLAGIDMDWDDNYTQDQKMELIHLQKYYALFLTDMQQWFEYRRTGHPNLPKGAGLRNNGVMPARMTYPIYILSTNPTNYKKAIANQGPDEISTQVWWQKP
ncbi:Starch-binding associating with outer membrane [Filimonas lacunae]|uniref:Starch-binding associating with outer membrane n=1 Tax=Filimonas lacunae TaxID=477680 RepID=A0A173MDI1_9BACT|nr:SusD/RagB family nutrient-binding outer membrane lipoprotein [Filimonas lacunae]BAV05644.1 hypothetical protein FLA_1655 [Filimonas lacunae]SIT29076.1 Starch-binding associating with outer membrane [Filimonas lacunae]